jgi:cytochrome b
MRLGHVLLGLIIFRVLWGFLGTDTARFATFVKGPGRLLAYFKGDYDDRREIGHNPLGALAVLGLLTLPLLQIVMGLFAGDPYDGATGPLNGLVSVGTADTLTETHEWFVYVVFAMIGLHIAAIAMYAGARMQNLVGPMVTGKGEKAVGTKGNSALSTGQFLIALAIAIALPLWIYAGAPPLG